MFERHDLIALRNGDFLTTHPEGSCSGERCSIHNPSEHAMSEFPQLWREDRGLMERLCRHGIGHPDPDDIAHKRRTRGDAYAAVEAVHGCDGCCRQRSFSACGHCGATDVGTFEGGYGSVGRADLCHPNESGRPDCYHLVTVYHHPMPCSACPSAEERTGKEA